MTLAVVDMHTGGEPVRIITSGYPTIPGATILEKRAYARDKLDDLRKLLIFEPRGHYDMYGAVLVKPSLPGADIAVLFLHNEGYSTMCGHAVIALGRYAVEQGLVQPVEPVTTVNIECPCGLVTAAVSVENGKAGMVSFESVPAFLLERDCTLDLAGFGSITFDIAYGGAFYAVADCAQLSLEFGHSRVRQFVDAATALSEAVKQNYSIVHPEHDDLGFLYGTILTDSRDGRGDMPTRNICVFANAEVDRSPTGSGVTARLAALHAKGAVSEGETLLFESITGARFAGEVMRRSQVGTREAIVARVTGRAYYTGRAEYTLEEGDELGKGFLLR